MQVGPWKCDSCAKLITQVKDGWVEWLRITDFDKDKSKEYGLRLVHNRPSSPRRYGCQYDEREEYDTHKAIVQDLPLEEYTGSQGLMNLLEMIVEEELPKEEIVEMIKRLHIPQYEQARDYFESAMSEGIFESNRTSGFYSQEQMEEVVQWAEKRKQEDQG